jgi:hypothetical protein
MTGVSNARQPRPGVACFMVLLMVFSGLCCIHVGAPAKAASGRALVNDTEPNDSYAQAQPIVFGDVVKGHMDIINDNKDVYKVHIDNGTVINISVIQTQYNPSVPADYDVNVEFIAPGPIHSLVRRESNLQPLETISGLAIETGDYFVWLYLGVNSKPVNYTMNIMNQTPAQIGRVIDYIGHLDASMTLAGTNPNVWFKLTVPPTKGIQVTLQVPKGSDFDMFALDEWARLPFYYPGHRNPLWLNASTDNSSAGNYEFLKATAWEGQYFLRIKAWPGSVGNYKMTLIDYDPVETDNNNVPTQAKVIDKKTLVKDNLQMSFDHFDWYKVFLPKGQKMNLTMTLLTSTYDIYNMSLYDQNLNLLTGVFDTESGNTYNDTNHVNSKCIIKNFTSTLPQYYYILAMAVRNIDQLEQESFRPLNSDYTLFFDLPDKGPTNTLDVAPISFNEDTTYSSLDISKVFSDTEGDPLTYSFSPSYLPNMTISIATNGSVTMKPVKDWNSGAEKLPITFKATDAWANTGTPFATVSTTVQVKPVDDGPSSTGTLPFVSLNETETVQMPGSLNTYFKDIDDDSFNFTVTGNGSVPVKIDDTEGSVTVGPVDGWFGSMDVNITAHDSGGLTAWQILNITVVHKNHAPEIIGNAERSLTMKEDQTDGQVLVTPWFTDKDLVYAKDHLVFSLGDPMPTNLMATIESGLIKLVPLADWSGQDVLWVVAKDDAKKEVRVKLTITVTSVNDPPKIITVLPAIREPTIKEGSNLTFKVVLVKDPEMNETMTYAWTVEGNIQTDTTSTLDFQTDYDPNSAMPSAGIYHIKVVVSDGQYTDSYQWNLTVQDINAPPVNVKILSPTAGQSFHEGSSITFKADNVTDIEGDPITWVWKDNVTGAVVGTGKVVKVNNLKKGPHMITLDVSDGTNHVYKNVTVIITKKIKKNTPGFEGVLVVGTLCMALVIISRRKRN